MPQLTGIDFAVTLDKSVSTPTITLYDTGSYPTGAPETISGIFTITFPDGTTRYGSFASPDVTFSGSGLTPFSMPTHLDSAGSFQIGTYTIDYEIDADGYLPTTLQKTFQLSSFDEPTISFTKSFDVFTPKLEITDATSYVVGGLTLSSVVRSWSSVIGTVTTVTGGNVTTFDMYYGSPGEYYDALYTTTLTSVVTWEMSSYSWVTIKSKIIGISADDIYSAPTLAELLSQLQDLEAEVDAATCNNRTVLLGEFNYAMSLYTLFVELGRTGTTVGLEDYLNHLQTIFNNNVVPKPAHTNQPLTNIPYDWANGVFVGSITGINADNIGNLPAVLMFTVGGNTWYAQQVTINP